MGKFKEAFTEAMNDQTWQAAEKLLKEKDGNIHIIMLNSFSKIANASYGVEDKYTTEVGEIVERMQAAGYEIVDIKFNSLQGQGLNGQREGFNTLIIYK